MFRSIARFGLHIVPGRGDSRLSLVHVDDLVEGLMLVSERGERLGEHCPPGQGVYFVAGGRGGHPTYAQLGEAIARALGREPPAVMHLPGTLMRLVGVAGDMTARLTGSPGWISSDKMTEARAGSWACYAAKAHAQLGWSAAATLEERLEETAWWYREAGWV